jgi:hypothetical protein
MTEKWLIITVKDGQVQGCDSTHSMGKDQWNVLVNDMDSADGDSPTLVDEMPKVHHGKNYHEIVEKVRKSYE